MKQLGLRHRILILAVALIVATQLVTFFPVLSLIRRDADHQAERTVGLAGALLDQYMRNRTDQLLTTVTVLVADYGFRQAVGLGDRATILSALRNHASRIGADVVALLDLDGHIIVSTPPPEYYGPQAALSVDALDEGATEHVIFLGDVPYQTVTVPVRAPATVGFVLLGFPINESLARELQTLTELDVSFLGTRGGEIQTFASTVPIATRAAINATLNPSTRAPQRTGEGNGAHLSVVRPFLTNGGDVYVAMHFPLADTIASFERIRTFLVAITALSLLLAILGSMWLARTVTRPVSDLVAAARRMREGVYTEPIETPPVVEIGELADSFNVMQRAIADRERQILHAAHHDGLSGLPNRELSIALLREATERHRQLSVVCLGLDRFDGIVASLGHRAGDEVIRLTAATLRGRIGEGQILGHLSGQTFVIGLPNRSAEEAEEWVTYQCDTLRAGVRVSGANISLQATGGVACYPDHSHDAAELCRRASNARADALQGHNVVATYRLGQEDRSLQQIRIVGDFPQALKNGELRLYFQPKLDLASGEIYGAEALVRWQHPELGFLPPDDFVGAIERAGSISQLTRWVLREAVERHAAWRAMGVNLSMAVNISVDDLSDEYLPYFLLEITQAHGVHPSQLTLEVTESAIMHNVHKSLAVVNCIHELGFRLAVDDFGTGQSALAQLNRLPVDELKIDRAFVMAHRDRTNDAILRATIDLAHRLGLTVVAEGVEDDGVIEHLAALGCERAQGYGIAKPMPHEKVLPWLSQWRAARRSGVVAFAAAAGSSKNAPKSS